ncbi:MULTISPECIES: condensation domain-containing protein [unclassified Nocardia]|uniref:condensation domain-containing protein n=1 Tax=unclassified Nocardia TaxID=2637762 RepID=UPI001CE3E78C|nr:MULTISPECIES: condensation domain-containing protein [unclassified Nocardia]
MSDTFAPAAAERGTPLSPAQQAALLPERLHGTPAVNLFVALEISGPVQVTELARAFAEVLAWYEILRTVYPADRRIPYQRVLPEADRVLELAGRIDPAELDARLLDDAAYRFEPARETPVRARYYELPEHGVLSIAVHPVAADDQGLELLVRAMLAAYSGAAQGNSAQYREFVPAQLRDMAADDPDLAYWRDRLAELPTAPVSVRSTGDVQRVLRVDPDTLAALVGAHPGADSAAVFAALVTTTLAEAGLGRDIPVGLVDPFRSAPGADAVLGNFANYLVLRMDAQGGRTPRAIIAAAAERTAEARAHARTRIERLTHLIGGGARRSLFAVSLRVHQGSAVDAPHGWTVRELLRRNARPVGADLVFDVAVDAEGARVRIDFPAALAGSPAVDEFVRQFVTRCRTWAANLDAVLPDPAAQGFTLFPAPQAEFPGLPGQGGPPATETERLLVETIREILEFDEDEEIGRADTFFSLGGDSIAALRLVTLLGERGYVVEVPMVFGFPVLHDLAAEIDRAAAAPAPAAVRAGNAPMSASGLDAAALRALGSRLAAE